MINVNIIWAYPGSSTKDHTYKGFSLTGKSDKEYRDSLLKGVKSYRGRCETRGSKIPTVKRVWMKKDNGYVLFLDFKATKLTGELQWVHAKAGEFV